MPRSDEPVVCHRPPRQTRHGNSDRRRDEISTSFVGHPAQKNERARCQGLKERKEGSLTEEFWIILNLDPTTPNTDPIPPFFRSSIMCVSFERLSAGTFAADDAKHFRHLRLGSHGRVAGFRSLVVEREGVEENGKVLVWCPRGGGHDEGRPIWS